MRKPLNELRQDIIIPYEHDGRSYSFRSTWGLFSQERIDAGSDLLLRYVKPATAHDDILDVGCGYGVLGIVLASQASQGVLHMVDKDFVGVHYAEKNAELNRIANRQSYLSNMLDAVPKGQQFDLIVSNLPAKAGRELFDVMLYQVREHLKPGGRLCVVTVVGLKEFVKTNFKEMFGNYEKLKQSSSHVVACATLMEKA